MRKNSATALTSPPTVPAGATHVAEWYDLNTDTPGRYFRGANWTVCGGNIEVLTDGTQTHDGSTRRFVTVIEGGYERLADLTAEQARELGQTLIAAADEIDAVSR